MVSLKLGGGRGGQVEANSELGNQGVKPGKGESERKRERQKERERERERESRHYKKQQLDSLMSYPGPQRKAYTYPNNNSDIQNFKKYIIQIKKYVQNIQTKAILIDTWNAKTIQIYTVQSYINRHLK